MLALTTAFATRLATPRVDDAFVLVVLEPPPASGLATQYLSLGQRSLTWGPTVDRHTYVCADAAHETLRSTLDAEPPESSLTLTNLDGSWYTTLNRDNKSLNGGLLTIRLVFATVDPADESDSIKSRIESGPFTITGARLDDNAVAFGFGLATDVLEFQFPSMLSRSSRCPFVYKGPFCKSTAAHPTCRGTISECAARHGSVLRFGAWPFTDTRIY